MPVLHCDNYAVTFPHGWRVSKFDDWTFYKKHFSRVRDGLKAMDIVAVCPEHVAYLIEFKDYRHRIRDKAVSIEAEFIEKSLSTLSALFPAACNGSKDDEILLAKTALRAKKIRLVLHLDQAKEGRRQFPPVAIAADLTQKLRNRLRSIDTHVKICSSDAMTGIPWTVGKA